MYQIVRTRNLAEIARELKAKRGYIIMAGPGYQSLDDMVVDGVIHLYHQATLNIDTPGHETLSCERRFEIRDGQEWQTGWERDREYIIRQKRKDELFAFLPLSKGYTFQIRMQSTVGQGFYYKGSHRAVFVPHKDGDMRKALLFAIVHVSNIIKEKPISENDVIQMLKYAKKDLVDGNILQKNAAVGMALDAHG
jgi:hypothetical protein